MQKFLPSLLTLMPPPPHFFLWHEKLKIRCTLYRWLWWHVLSYKQEGKLRSSSVSQLRTRRSGKPGGIHQVWHLSKQDSVLSLKQDVCITALPSKAQEDLQRRAQQGGRTEGVGGLLENLKTRVFCSCQTCHMHEPAVAVAACMRPG